MTDRISTPCAPYPRQPARWTTLATLALAAGMVAAPAFAKPPEPPAPAAVETVKVRATAKFQFDGTALDDADRAALLADVAQIKDVSWQRITAVGHADSVGETPYNEALALRRAQAVRQYLTSQGIPASLIDVATRGEAQPVATNGTPEGRARNRRAEVEFVGVRTR